MGVRKWVKQHIKQGGVRSKRGKDILPQGTAGGPAGHEVTRMAGGQMCSS